MDLDSANEDSDIDSTSATVGSDSDTELYNLESSLDSQSDGSELPNIDYLRAELTPVARLRNLPASHPQDFQIPENSTPATPIYSPTSPDYSPSQSPVHVASDREEECGFIPPHNSEGPIATRYSDIFELENTDSDQEFEGEAELISLIGDYINRGKIPTRMLGVYFHSLLTCKILHGMNIPMNPVLIIV